MKKVLIIIAAGDASRMGYSPKAVALINGKPNLLNTVEKARDHFDEILVFSNDKFKDLYEKILIGQTNVRVVVIESGRGCGHAVMMALRTMGTHKYHEDVVMCWGDVYFQSSKQFEEIKEVFVYETMVIPVVEEPDPYVWFKYGIYGNIMLVHCAMFSKNGEGTPTGYHDQSIFKFNHIRISGALEVMNAVMDRNGEYSNGEMRFLDVVHYLHNSRVPSRIYETLYDTDAYNTESELQTINDYLQKSDLK